MIYLGDNWPDRYRGQVFMNNIHGQRINTDILEQHGSGFVGHHGKDFLLSYDLASQILNLFDEGIETMLVKHRILHRLHRTTVRTQGNHIQALNVVIFVC